MTEVIRRMVLMTLAPDADAARLVADAHQSLTRIPGVECVAAAEPVELIRGASDWTHASVLEFQDRASLDAYADHPQHRQIQHVLDTFTRAVTVIQLAPGGVPAPREAWESDREPDDVTA